MTVQPLSDAALSVCSLNYKQTKNIPVFFQNFKNYDGHFIVQYLSKIKLFYKICDELYIISIDDLAFIVSYNSLSIPLSKLATNLDNYKFIDNTTTI